MGHAVLSPSSASRWLACTPSARLEQQFPDRTSAAAAEGTVAHGLGELLLRRYLGEATDQQVQEFIALGETQQYYNPAMYDYADGYATFVLERLNEARSRTSDAVIRIEQRLDMTEYVPEGYGTGDAVIIADGVMDVIDLKYGKGVAVYAESNRQMMLYALGALCEFDIFYDIRTVRMTIYQPRLDNISEWEIDVEVLRYWAESELRERAELAYEGKGEFTPGAHCRFCKASGLCRVLADQNLEATKYDFKQPELLTDDEVADILGRADALKKWLASIETHALTEAVDNGKQWPGYKLVEGRSNRIYSDPTQVAALLRESGWPDEVTHEKKLLGITAMEKLLSRKVFDSLLDSQIVKPQGKPTLVPESDKRPQWSSSEAAAIDFSDNYSD